MISNIEFHLNRVKRVNIYTGQQRKYSLVAIHYEYQSFMNKITFKKLNVALD